MRHAAAHVLRVLHCELAELFAPQCVKQQRGENGTVALALDRLGLGCGEQLADLVVTERRRLAFAAFRFRALDAFDRVVRDGVLLAEIFEQRGQCCQAVADRGIAPWLAAPGQARSHVVAPGDDVRAGHAAKFLRSLNAGEAHKIPDRVFIGAARVSIGEVLEPLDLGRHIGELLELSGGQQPAAGYGLGWKLLITGDVGRVGHGCPAGPLGNTPG